VAGAETESPGGKKGEGKGKERCLLFFSPHCSSEAREGKKKKKRVKPRCAFKVALREKKKGGREGRKKLLSALSVFSDVAARPDRGGRDGATTAIAALRRKERKEGRGVLRLPTQSPVRAGKEGKKKEKKKRGRHHAHCEWFKKKNCISFNLQSSTCRSGSKRKEKKKTTLDRVHTAGEGKALSTCQLA